MSTTAKGCSVEPMLTLLLAVVIVRPQELASLDSCYCALLSRGRCSSCLFVNIIVQVHEILFFKLARYESLSVSCIVLNFYKFVSLHSSKTNPEVSPSLG